MTGIILTQYAVNVNTFFAIFRNIFLKFFSAFGFYIRKQIVDTVREFCCDKEKMTEEINLRKPQKNAG